MLRPFLVSLKFEDLVVLKELIEAGKVTPVIDRTYPLTKPPRRSAMWERGTLEGKSSSSPCEANPKEDFCSQSGGEDVTGDHPSGPGGFRTPRHPTRSFGPSSTRHDGS